jgi:hypothetical protein
MRTGPASVILPAPACAVIAALLFCVSCSRAQENSHAPTTLVPGDRVESALRSGAPGGGGDGGDLTLMLAGDIMLGTDWPDSSRLPGRSGAGLLDRMHALLQRGDLALANLEGPLQDGGSTDKCADTSRDCHTFRTPVAFTARLREAGFDALSIANNHALDFGTAGRRSTIRALDSAGIAWSGPPGTFAVLNSRGRRVVFVAFSYDDDSNNLLRLDDARERVSRLASQADIVVVSFHGGAEGAGADAVPDSMEIFLDEWRGDTRTFARAMVDAGADLVFGHGPHVLRGMEVYRNRLIAYSLGNFATSRGISIAGPGGIACVLEARIGPDGSFTGGIVHPTVQIRHGMPVPDPQRRACVLMNTLSQRDFPGTAPVIALDGALRTPPARVHPSPP